MYLALTILAVAALIFTYHQIKKARAEKANAWINRRF